MTSWAAFDVSYQPYLHQDLGFIVNGLGNQCFYHTFSNNVTIWVGKFGSKFAFLEMMLFYTWLDVIGLGRVIWSSLMGNLMGLGRVGGLFVRILNPLGKIVGAFLAGWYIGSLSIS